MCNHLYKYFTDQKILHPQQFDLRKSHPSEHPMAQLVDQTYKSFDINNYTASIFVEF